jgi:hypothetical protein
VQHSTLINIYNEFNEEQMKERNWRDGELSYFEPWLKTMTCEELLSF